MTADYRTERKRILVLTSTFPRWEGDREPPFVFELSRRLKTHFDIMVLAPHATGAKRTETFENIEVHRFRYFFCGWQRLAYEGGILANLKKNRLNYLLIPFFMVAESLSILRLLKSFKVDVIHAHWLIPQGIVALGALMFSNQRPAVVCTSHGGDLYGLSGKLLTQIKRWVIRKTDKLTVVSHAMKDYAMTLSGRSDISVISMGVDLTGRFVPASEENRSANELLYVGRLVEKKGVRYLILAMPDILKEHPQAKLTIAGDGPEKKELQELARRLGIDMQVNFLGSVDNAALPKLYQRTGVFVVPSVMARGGDQEGLGLVIVEALGCACAVIASDLPAIKDVVIDGVTGLVCRQKDSADLAQKILHLLNNPGLREQLGNQGRDYVAERFDWEIVAHRYAALLEQEADFGRRKPVG